jgi:hypothetical protein
MNMVTYSLWFLVNRPMEGVEVCQMICCIAVRFRFYLIVLQYFVLMSFVLRVNVVL